MEKIVVVEGARTAVGGYAGSLSGTPNHVMGATAMKAAVERAGVSVEAIDEVVVGCVGQVGGDAFLARRIALAAGVREDSNAFTVNRLCGSGLQAVQSAAFELQSGDSKFVVAGGSENMSRQPFMDFDARNGWKMGHHTLIDGTLSLVTDPFGNYPMGVTAENVAEKHAISREDQDEFAALSQERAAAAQEAGLFAPEIVGVTVKEKKSERVFDVDEHLRPGTTVEKLAKLRPAFRDGGSVTAGNSSGINDAAAMLVLTTESVAKAEGLKPIGEFVSFAKAGVSPEVMGFAPALAIPRALEKAGLTLADIDWIELNEAFAAQALSVIRDQNLDMEKTNPLGGAIALGHPVGATGTILSLRTLYNLRRTGKEFGLVSMCIGGGQGVAAVYKAL
ncbi:acetyl-CoA C-acetyltransferase [Arcanobacterium pluranimalium]|uniref:thiolase family protein n=1 Tax=Arcanobacterium pluranimalium TaxID=108028 RepID=UPI001959AC48|nr:thiolase family protein [Arcanobacterium pluranimalium]MBM7825547.1 acetyl-CoA C-acetyltransferase [Arcanobacterium pluranimalium]